MSELIELESSVERVEVYRSEALVTRRSTAALAGRRGRVSLLFTGLPLGLREGSVRLDLAEQSGVRVVDLHLAYSVGRRDGALRTAAEQNLRDLARERLTLEVALDQQRARMQFLQSLQPSLPRAQDMPERLAFEERPVVEGWLALTDFCVAGLDETQTKIRGLQAQRRDLLDRIRQARDAIERESQAELQALAVCRKTARVQLEIGQEMDELDLRLSYLVPGARWVPEYELRVFESADEAELVLRALVAQRSGDDWEKAELAFSTADLKRSTELPELESWRIGKAQAARSSGWRPLPEGLDELFEAYDQGVRSLPAAPDTSVPDLPDMPVLKKGREEKPVDRGLDANQLLERLARAAVPAPVVEPAPAPKPAPKADYDEREHALDMEEESFEAADMMDDMAPSSAPMPASMAPPAPMRMAAPPAELRRAKKSKGARGGRAMSGALRSEMMAQNAVSAGMAMLDEGLLDAEQGKEGDLEASAEALGFQGLRMQGPDSGSLRGQLKAASVAERIRDSVADADEQVQGAVNRVPAEVWSAAVRAPAHSLSGLALPRHAVSLDQSAGHFAVRYPMESLGSVPPDGQLHSLTLVRKRGAVRRVFRTVPSADDHVYQMVEFENPLDLPLLAGPVRVYREGDYVVTAPLWTTPPGKTLTVNLGVEPAIVVARNVHFKESTEGLFGGDTALEHRVEIEVRSKLGQPVHVELFERLPYTNDDDIKVALLETSPKAESYDQTDRGRPIHGGLRFSFDLQAQKSITCKLTYRITIPSKQVLEGGNRRD